MAGNPASRANLVIRTMNLRQFFSGRGITDVDKYRQSAATRSKLAQQFEALSGQIRALRREAGDIAAWSRKAINKPAANGVDGQGEDDRNSRCRLPCSRDSVAPGHNDIDVGINKLCRNLGEAFGASLCPAIDYFNCVPVYPTMFAQPFFKGGNRLYPQLLGHSSKKPDYRPLLLRPKWERPHSRTAKHRDELATSHSITSSARAISVDGIVRPRTLAVVRLRTRSNLVGCSTGMSPGFAPRRILSTISAVRLHWSRKFDPYDISPPVSTYSREL